MNQRSPDGKIIDPILQGWAGPATPPVASYAPGRWGPAEADRFLASVGRAWLDTSGGHTVVAS